MPGNIYDPSPEELDELERKAETERLQREKDRLEKQTYSGPPITWLDLQAGYQTSENH